MVMAISVTEPIGRGFERVKEVLFRPFVMGKWFVLGFCAFLAGLGEAGGGFNFRFGQQFRGPGGPGGEDIGRFLREAMQWVNQHLPLVVLIVLGLIALSLAFGALLLWLGSRGKFMFLDGVVRNRGAVVEPWHRLGRLGNSLFVFRFVLTLIGMGVGLVVGVACLALAWPDLNAGRFGPGVVTAIVIAVCTFLPMALVLGIVQALLGDFVTLIMYRRDLNAVPAFRILWREILPGHVWTVVLFYLMKFVLGLAAGMIVMLGTCLTCCIAGLPYISSVVFLPVTVFFRSYSLYFLEQFGPDWRLIEPVLELEPVA
jgi:hypothetical protein